MDKSIYGVVKMPVQLYIMACDRSSVSFFPLIHLQSLFQIVNAVEQGLFLGQEWNDTLSWLRVLGVTVI